MAQGVTYPFASKGYNKITEWWIKMVLSIFSKKKAKLQLTCQEIESVGIRRKRWNCNIEDAVKVFEVNNNFKW